MFQALISTLPLMVTILWMMIYALQWSNLNKPQRSGLLTMGAAAVYYFCATYVVFHGFLPWLAYPALVSTYAIDVFFYFAIILFTSPDEKIPRYSYLLLMPSVLVVGVLIVWPDYIHSFMAAFIKLVIKLYTLTRSIILLLQFRKRILNAYSSIEHRNLRPIRIIVICMMVFAVLVFYESVRHMLNLPQTTHGLYWVTSALFYFFIYYYVLFHSFTAHEARMEMEAAEALLTENAAPVFSEERIKTELDRLMTEEHVFLQPDLKITDLARMLGTNRTYLSGYINQNLNLSFSDFINMKRIEYADEFISSHPDASRIQIASNCGYFSVQSFLNNYNKFGNSKI